MKRFALIAAAALLAAPAFAQSVISTTTVVGDSINLGAVPVTPPVDALPGGYQGLAFPAPLGTVALSPSAAVVAMRPGQQVAIAAPNTGVLGAGPAVMHSGTAIPVVSSAILDTPQYSVTKPDFHRWLAWEGSRTTGSR